EINSHVYLSSRRRQTRSKRDWSSDVCSSDLSLGVLTVKSVQKYCNPNVQIMGILFTRFNPRANISRQIKELTEQLSEYISAPIRSEERRVGKEWRAGRGGEEDTGRREGVVER